MSQQIRRATTDQQQEQLVLRASPATKQQQNKRPSNNFFGLPILGFFRDKDEETAPFLEKSIASSSNNRTYDSTAITLSSSSPATTNVPLGGGDSATATTDGQDDAPLLSSNHHDERSAKDLWTNVGRHVKRASFHIRDFRSEEEKKHVAKHFSDLELPYEFSILECLGALILYLLLSVVAYSYVFESFSMIDSMYFAVVTFTTIGYGDVVPTSMGGKLFTTVFAFGGVVILGIALGVVGSKFVEAQVEAVERAEQELSEDLFEMLGFGKNDNDATSSSKLGPSSVSGESSERSLLDDTSLHSSFYKNDEEKQGWAHDGKVKMWCIRFCKLLYRYSPALCPLVLGAFYTGRHEGWTWYDTIYYCVITTTTVGYGDKTPEQQSMKLFAILFIPLAVGAMGHMLGTIANFIVESRRRVYQKRLYYHELSLKDLERMDANQDGAVTELEYVAFMLQIIKKVDKEMIDALRERFRELDLTNNGTLDRRDLELMAKRQLRGIKHKLQLSSYKYKLTHSGHRKGRKGPASGIQSVP